MARLHNTTKEGNAWTEETKLAVWKKSQEIPSHISHIVRRDKCGTVIKWAEHGNRDSENGWEIDHINPVSNKGEDDIDNLQPLNWKNNADKSDKLNWSCPVK